MTKEQINKRLKEHYDTLKGKEVFAIFLQGSQNYIEDKFLPESDIDSKAVVFPTKKDLYLGNIDQSKERILENDEHLNELDVRNFLKILKKPGVNNYESLFTEYVIVNPKYEKFYKDLVSIRENIVRMDEKKFLMSLMGMSFGELKLLEKSNGSQSHDVDKYGYSRKRLANVLRYNALAKAYLENKDFSSCLKALNQNDVYNIRTKQVYTLDEARKLAHSADKETTELAKSFKCVTNNAKETNKKLEKIFVDMIEESLKQ